MRTTLAALRRGTANFPGYSHLTYDIDPALSRSIARPDVVIVEGLGLHEPANIGLDALLYPSADALVLDSESSGPLDLAKSSRPPSERARCS